MFFLEKFFTILSSTSIFLWLLLLIQPWQPWRIREYLEANKRSITNYQKQVPITVIIPARNEEEIIEITLEALNKQGQLLDVIVVDDQSTDNTKLVVNNIKMKNLKIELVSGKNLPPGWAGKMWALEQALNRVKTELILILDADIRLHPEMLKTLVEKRYESGARLVSVMVELRMESFWEKLLMPAFVFFFKILYPFKLLNSSNRYVAAAAGGCILTDSSLLHQIGGFSAIKDALIDDCALAKLVKNSGETTWIGLTKNAHSFRAYTTLSSIWKMVKRNAFTQLRSSLLLILICTVLMILAFWVPIISIIASVGATPKFIGIGALVLMLIAYIPTLNFYKRSPFFALLMPVIGTLYLSMTWSSAISYWIGAQSKWKGRTYTRLKRK